MSIYITKNYASMMPFNISNATTMIPTNPSINLKDVLSNMD